MEIKTLELFIDGDAFWFTLLSFDYKNQNRSLFHIEYGYGCL